MKGEGWGRGEGAMSKKGNSRGRIGWRAREMGDWRRLGGQRRPCDELRIAPGGEGRWKALTGKKRFRRA